MIQSEATLMEMTLRGGDLQGDTQGTYRRLESGLEEYWAKYMAGTCFVLLKVTCSPYGINRIGLVVQDLD